MGNLEADLNYTVMKWASASVKKLIEENTSTNSPNPTEIIREKARDLVLKAFNLGWSGPPFDPIELAKIFKIEVSPYEEIPDARIIPLSGNRLKIEYNPFQKETRINFSIAHEIAHTLFSDCNEKIRNRENKKTSNDWEVEFLCDVAASEILLPYSQFANEANSVPLNLESLLKISNKYKASLESVFLRFCEVNDKACAMIIASFSDETQTKLRVDYFKSSNAFNMKIPSDFIIPVSSCAYECLNAGWTAHKPEKWLDPDELYTTYSIGLMPLRKGNRQRVGIFIVPAQYGELPDNSLYTVFGDATRPRGDGIKIIVQVLNTSGGLGFGFGKSMGLKWPASKKAAIKWKEDKSTYKLGGNKLTQLDESTYVFQIIAQHGLFEKNGIIPLKYDALRDGLRELASVAAKIPASIHMPLIGAGQAKGDWSIIQGIIHDEIVTKGVNVNVYILPGTKPTPKKNISTLSLFDETTLYEK